MRGLNNWTFGEVVGFLLGHGFVECTDGHAKRTSHHYYQRCYKAKYYLVHVQFHPRSSIAIGTMKAIVKTSGISEIEWRNK